MGMSYSMHLSNKKNAVSTSVKLAQVDKHNLGKYKNHERDVQIIAGDPDLSIVENTKRIYRDEFTAPLEKFNANKRPDRRIDDYMKHVSESRADVAAEIIIQIGDKDFWQDIDRTRRKAIAPVFLAQIEKLQEEVPEFKIAMAVIHWDESSPHMHIVGVPVADGYQKGLEKQVAKTKVFTPERLSRLQDVMREDMERSMQQFPEIFAGQEMKEKERGRNKDIPKESLDEFYEIERQKTREKAKVNTLAQISEQLTDPERTEPVIIRTKKEEKQLTPVPELLRINHQEQQQFQLLHEQRLQEEAAVERLKKQRRKMDLEIKEKMQLLEPRAFNQILNDSVTANLVQDTMMETCRELSRQGIIKDPPEAAFMKLNKKHVIEKLRDRTEAFLEKVKDHMREMAEKVLRRDRER